MQFKYLLAICENLAYFAPQFDDLHIVLVALNLNLMTKNSLSAVVILILCILFLDSCTPVKNVIYFENLQKDTTLRNLAPYNFEQKIRKSDLLGITIISPDPITTPLFNGMQSGGFSATNSGESNSGIGGYLVDNAGNITLYKLGVIHVEGLTRGQLKAKLDKDLSPYLKDAVVTVRYLNNKITILGEVTKPQVINMPTEQISILDAIAQCGDLTIAGKRDNILVIRETENGKQFKRLNLNDKSIFYSPFYYLKPDDVVYVEPSKFKIMNASQSQQTISYALSALSILITLISLLR